MASRHLFQLLCRVQSDPSESKLAALLQQYSELSQSSISSPLLETTTAELNTYMVMYVNSSIPFVNVFAFCLQCWKRLQVSVEHLDLLKNFPPHFRFLVLQHSEDKYVETYMHYKLKSLAVTSGQNSTLHTSFHHNLLLLSQRKASLPPPSVYTM